MSRNGPSDQQEPNLQVLPRGRLEAVRVEVLEAVGHGQHTLAAVRVLAGELHSETTLVVEETGERWRVLGLGFIPVAAWADGRRALTLAPLGEAKPLHQGDRLVGE